MTTLLRPPAVTADLIESTVAAPESLRPWITELGRIPKIDNLSDPFTHVPNAATTIVLRTEEHSRREALVVGPQTRANYSRADKPASCIRLRLAPGAAQPLLGVPAAALADRIVRLADLPGVAADFAAELSELSAEEVFPYLEATLPQRLSEGVTQRAHRTLLYNAIATLAAHPTGPPVAALAATLSVSERQLRNLFTAGVGVSPKHFARIGRVRHILTYGANPLRPESAGTTGHYEDKTASGWWAQLTADKRADGRANRTAPGSLAQLAAASGFYDQSHMTADFRALMGVPPTKFFQGNLPAPTPCQALSKV